MGDGKLTVSDIITRVQRTFGDESAVQVTNDDIIRWINDAQREVVMQHDNLLQTHGYLDTVAGQQEYTNPTDCLLINAILYRNSTDATASYYELRFMNPAQLQQSADGWRGGDFGSSTPQFFTRGDNGKFLVFPAPDTSRVNGFQLIYSRYATDVTDVNSSIDLPPYYHSYVEHFCMMKAYEMDEDWESADRKAALVQSTINFNVNRESWFGRETYPTITTNYGDLD